MSKRPASNAAPTDVVEHFEREASQDRQRLGELRTEAALLVSRFVPKAELQGLVLRFLELTGETHKNALAAGVRAAASGAAAVDAVLLAVSDELATGFERVLELAYGAIETSSPHDRVKRELWAMREELRASRNQAPGGGASQ